MTVEDGTLKVYVEGLSKVKHKQVAFFVLIVDSAEAVSGGIVYVVNKDCMVKAGNCLVEA